MLSCVSLTACQFVFGTHRGNDCMPKHFWRKTILLLSKVEIGPVCNPGTSQVPIVSSEIPSTTLFLVLLFGFLKKSQRDRCKEKKKAAFNLSDSSKQHSSEHWNPQSKAPMDTVMRSRYALFRKQYKNRLMQNQAMEITVGPGDAASSDSWRFCIA